MLKLLGRDAEVSNYVGVLVVVRLHHAREFRSGVANDGLATALDRLADTIQLQGVLDRRIQRLDHLVRRILRCKQSDPGTQLISLNAGLGDGWNIGQALRSEEHTSELQSLMRISYAVFCLKKKKHKHHITTLQIH